MALLAEEVAFFVFGFGGAVSLICCSALRSS